METSDRKSSRRKPDLSNSTAEKYVVIFRERKVKKNCNMLEKGREKKVTRKVTNTRKRFVL